MGACLAKPKPKGAKGASRAHTEFELTLAKNVKEIAFQGQEIPKSFNQLLMKLPKLATRFNQVKELFHAFDVDKNGGIDITEMKKAFADLGAVVSEDKVTQYFNEADMNNDKIINFGEFLLCLSFIYFVDHFQPAHHGEEFNELHTAFTVCAQAFAFFDIDGGGTISKTEVEKALQVGGSKSQSHAHRTREKGGADSLFAEMDIDHSGQVSFKEFLLALVHFSGAEDEDE